MAKKQLNITEIYEAVRLLKMANLAGQVLVSQLARELGTKTTTLMLFIESNPKLFKTAEVKGRGLAVKWAYLRPEDNMDTDEWLAKKKKEWDKKLYVGIQWYYGVFEFFFIDEDAKSEGGRKWEYRNTAEKMAELERMGIKKERCIYGGLSDTYYRECIRVTPEVIATLEANGWTSNYKEAVELSRD